MAASRLAMVPLSTNSEEGLPSSDDVLSSSSGEGGGLKRERIKCV